MNNRRDFLKAGIAIGATASLLNIGKLSAAEPATAD